MRDEGIRIGPRREQDGEGCNAFAIGSRRSRPSGRQVCEQLPGRHERRALEQVDEAVKILGLAGSLREASYNRALLRAASHLVPAGVAMRTFDGLGSLPFFDADVEAAGLPARVADLRRAIAESDALLIATPEYNDGTSAVLKNALDWASRGPIRILAGKPVAVMGAATGRGGARGGQQGRGELCRGDALRHLR